MESDASRGAHASEPAPGDSIRSLIVSFLSYLELRLKLLGLETRETGIQFLVLALLLVSAIVFFAGFVAMLIAFLLYPDDADLPLGMGLERPSTCSGARYYQYCFGADF